MVVGSIVEGLVMVRGFLLTLGGPLGSLFGRVWQLPA
jgi:hypothetical protein